MGFSNTQMTITHLRNAKRPWLSDDSVRVDSMGRVQTIAIDDQAEIEACLNCPFPECNGALFKCRSYRAHAEAEARRKYASIRTSRP